MVVLGGYAAAIVEDEGGAATPSPCSEGGSSFRARGVTSADVEDTDSISSTNERGVGATGSGEAPSSSPTSVSFNAADSPVAAAALVGVCVALAAVVVFEGEECAAAVSVRCGCD